MKRLYKAVWHIIVYSPQTALRLLDCDFPDEAIREFAIRVLENSKRMTDERLEDLLLQLTQVSRL